MASTNTTLTFSKIDFRNDLALLCGSYGRADHQWSTQAIHFTHASMKVSNQTNKRLKFDFRKGLATFVHGRADLQWSAQAIHLAHASGHKSWSSSTHCFILEKIFSNSNLVHGNRVCHEVATMYVLLAEGPEGSTKSNLFSLFLI